MIKENNTTEEKASIFITGFHGYNNYKWFVREWLKMYSGTEPSFFSHKRVQTGIAFTMFSLGWIGVLVYLFIQEYTTILEFVEWAIPPLLICGYTLNKTEAAKSLKRDETKNEEQK